MKLFVPRMVIFKSKIELLDFASTQSTICLNFMFQILFLQIEFTARAAALCISLLVL